MYNNKFKEFEDGEYTFSSFVYVLISDNLKDDKYAVKKGSTHPDTYVNKCEHCSKADKKKRPIKIPFILQEVLQLPYTSTLYYWR